MAKPDPYDTLVHMTTGMQVSAQSLSDEELIEGARAGYDAYIGALWRRHGPTLLEAIRHKAGDRAEEIVNDVFMTLPRLLERYEHHGKFPEWLYIVANNRVRTKRRSDERRPEQAMTPDVVEPVRDPSALARIDEKQVLEHVRAELSENLREAWLLAYKGFGPAEIAARLGISESAAAVRVHRAREQVARRFPGMRR